MTLDAEDNRKSVIYNVVAAITVLVKRKGDAFDHKVLHCIARPREGSPWDADSA